MNFSPSEWRRHPVTYKAFPLGAVGFRPIQSYEKQRRFFEEIQRFNALRKEINNICGGQFFCSRKKHTTPLICQNILYNILSAVVKS